MSKTKIDDAKGVVGSPEAESESGINACFVPYMAANPYQGLLASSLRAEGVEITKTGGLKGLVQRVLRGREKINLIHLHWLPTFESGIMGKLRLMMFYCRLLLLRLLGRRFVWTVHNLYGHEGVSQRSERWLARRVLAISSRVITHSETARELVAQEFGCKDRKKLVVIPHGNYVDCYPSDISGADARAKLGLDPESVVALFFGNIRPYKGVPELIDAFEAQETSDITLLIAGRPLNENTVSVLERRISGNPRVMLRAGFVPDDEVQLYLNASDVVVFPYQDILTSGAVILAMSFGRACVAPALGCIPDVLDDQGAFLYDPDRPDGLREALEQAIRDRTRLEEMGAYNLHRTAEWGWDRVARETADVYAAAISDC